MGEHSCQSCGTPMLADGYPPEKRCTCCGHERMECDCIACDCFATPAAEPEETP